MDTSLRRVVAGAAIVTAMVLGPLAIATVLSPAVGWACNDGGQWVRVPDGYHCVPPPPDAPSPEPFNLCVGAPVPFVAVISCYPVG
jgi:hypothetical protein